MERTVEIRTLILILLIPLLASCQFTIGEYRNYGEVPFALLLGQSNASGRAIYSDTTLLDTTRIPNYIWSITNQQWEFINLPDSGNQIQGDNITQRWGLEMSMMHRIYNRYTLPAYIFKCGEGGTSLAVDWNPTTDGYNWVLFRENWLSAYSFVVNPPQFLIWWHGEADAELVETASAYYNNMVIFIDSVRALPNLSNVKFILMKLNDNADYPYVDTVQVKQQALCDSISEVYCYDLNQQTLGADDKHYTPQSYINVGKYIDENYWISSPKIIILDGKILIK